MKKNSSKLQKALIATAKTGKSPKEGSLQHFHHQAKQNALIYIKEKAATGRGKNGATSFHKQTINFLLQISSRQRERKRNRRAAANYQRIECQNK
jgi:hypothetical protein